LSAEEERLFYRLIVNCDDYGRMESRPEIVRARCMPLRVDDISTAQVEEWLRRMEAVGLILLYTVEGKRYLQKVTWTKHQHVRAKFSKYPAPVSTCEQTHASDRTCVRSTNNDIRITNNDIRSTDSDPMSLLTSFVANHFGTSPHIVERITSYLEPSEGRDQGMEPGCVMRACEIAVEMDKRTVRYVESILNRWYEAGIRTRDQAQYAERRHRKAGQGGSPQPDVVSVKLTPEQKAKSAELTEQLKAFADSKAVK
jgi:DnaD/phage-associated family protein